MLARLSSPTEVLILRFDHPQAADPIVAHIEDLRDRGIIRILDLVFLSADVVRPQNRGSIAVLVLEHLWHRGLAAALAEAHGEVIVDADVSHASGGPPTWVDPFERIRELNELRKVGTLTEAEFADLKRKLLRTSG